MLPSGVFCTHNYCIPTIILDLNLQTCNTVRYIAATNCLVIGLWKSYRSFESVVDVEWSGRVHRRWVCLGHFHQWDLSQAFEWCNYAARSSVPLPCMCLSDGVHTSFALHVVLDCGVGYFWWIPVPGFTWIVCTRQTYKLIWGRSLHEPQLWVMGHVTSCNLGTVRERWTIYLHLFRINVKCLSLRLSKTSKSANHITVSRRLMSTAQCIHP